MMNCNESLASKLMLAGINFYRTYINRLKRHPHCRYTPTCSSYAALAIKRYGACKGFLLAAWRILRCNPFAKGGYDPVP
ncbi:MAG: membrane protein insertion efficiency factor YidD [Eubacteriales bacterium]|nr:membrane protein insertion efficiency factor YidD [Eubacteriales bacterium]